MKVYVLLEDNYYIKLEGTEIFCGVFRSLGQAMSEVDDEWDWHEVATVLGYDNTHKGWRLYKETLDDMGERVGELEATEYFVKECYV